MKNNLYSIACHVHTKYSSDGYNSFSALYRIAKKYEIDCICITDHDTMQGGLAFLQWLKKNNKTDLDVVIGSEITCENNIHIIGLFLTKEVKSKRCLDVISEIKAQNGLVYLPHPARDDGALAALESDIILKSADLYEIFNAKVVQHFNECAQKSKPDNIAPFGGSDSHYNIDIGKCICYIPKYSSSREAFDKYLVERKIKIVGHRKVSGSNNYFATYYKYKQILRLPKVLKSIAKFLYPVYKNLKDRNKNIINEVLYDNF